MLKKFFSRAEDTRDHFSGTPFRQIWLQDRIPPNSSSLEWIHSLSSSLQRQHLRLPPNPSFLLSSTFFFSQLLRSTFSTNLAYNSFVTAVFLSATFPSFLFPPPPSPPLSTSLAPQSVWWNSHQKLIRLPNATWKGKGFLIALSSQSSPAGLKIAIIIKGGPTWPSQRREMA